MPEVAPPFEDKQLESVRLADVPVGQVIYVRTRQSYWSFCLTQNSRFNKEGRATDVMVMTNSGSWSSVNNQGPQHITVDPVFEVGKVIQINVWIDSNPGYTGPVTSISLA